MGDPNQVRDLMAVLEVTRQLGATTDLGPLLETIERSSIEVLGCERATVFLYDAASHELYSKMATGGKVIRFSADLGIAGEAFRTATVINVPDAYADARFNQEVDRSTGFRTRNMLTFPLLGYDSAPVGVLQVLNKIAGAFTNWDETLVRSFGAQAGVAIQRQFLLDEFAHKQRLERDLDLARTIQQGLLPRQAPTIPGYELAGWNKPADKTGGDFFDFIVLSGGRIALAIADVTGHGIGPALVVSECKALVRALLVAMKELPELMRTVNNLLTEDLPDDRFVTMFLGIIDPQKNELDFQSAGQGPLLLYRRDRDELEELPVTSPLLGVLLDLDFDSCDPVTMGPGDILVLCTDGILEWANPSKQQFGTERLLHSIRNLRDESSSRIIEGLHRDVITFSQGTEQLDDLTIVILKRDLT